MGKGTDYIVEKKEEVPLLGKSGNVISNYRIWATSKGGTYFHVDVPEEELAKADDLLTKKAKQLDAI